MRSAPGSSGRTWARTGARGRDASGSSRLGEHSLTSDLIGELNLPSADALHLAIGSGELSLAQVTGALERRLRGKAAPAVGADLPPIGQRRKEKSADVQVEGVGDLMSTHARCCNPVPPEPITGYVTVGRGITLHRTGCRNLARLAARAPQRLLQVDWGKSKGRRYPVEIVVHAMDRRGLLRDITTVVAEEHIDIERLASQVTRPRAVPTCRCVSPWEDYRNCRACWRGFPPCPASSAPGAAHETKGTVPSGSDLSDSGYR